MPPPPLPPVTLIVASGAPYVALAGAVIERVAWAALLIVTLNGADVVGS